MTNFRQKKPGRRTGLLGPRGSNENMARAAATSRKRDEFREFSKYYLQKVAVLPREQQPHAMRELAEKFKRSGESVEQTLARLEAATRTINRFSPKDNQMHAHRVIPDASTLMALRNVLTNIKRAHPNESRQKHLLRLAQEQGLNLKDVTKWSDLL